MNKSWLVRDKRSNNLIEQILINRGIAKKDWALFLNPDFKNGLFDPYLLLGMEEAVVRLTKAVLGHEKIGIFADYDADGIPAAALLSEILEKKLKLKTIVYIPARREGYGLNKKGIDYLKQQGAGLIITVDLGVREIANTEYAKKSGLDVIITDHHEPGEILPEPLALINPKLKDSRYPFRELSGGGVVFKLIQALAKEFTQIKEADLKWALDLVGITTICDVVPLQSENRIFAKFGLTVLQKTKRLGLQKLYQIANIDPVNIDTYNVGFQIGPRLNAPGRMNEANESYILLRTEDPREAAELAGRLDKINRERQEQLDQILRQAEARIEEGELYNKKVIMLSDKSWTPGLIGLVAGKITEEFNRPCFIFEEGKISSKGSARSISGFHLVDVLSRIKIIDNFGGHAKAAGLTLKTKNLEKFYSEITKIAKKELSEDDLIPKITIDAELDINQLNLKTCEEVSKLEPFGMGNPRPVFMIKNQKPQHIRLIGENSRHLKFKINDIDCIAFNQAEKAILLNNNGIDLVFYMEKNTWQDVERLQLKVLDLKCATT